MQRAEQIQSLHRSFTRLEKFFNQLMRQQFSCCSITVQQWYTLEALMDGPKTMNELAAQVALHQSTMTRIVEKLEKQAFVTRTRKTANQRTVEVRITASGGEICIAMDKQCAQMTADLLDLLPSDRQAGVVEAVETFTRLLDPADEAFQQVLRNCCNCNCIPGDEK